MTYSLLDSGEGRKVERFGDVVIERPCSQAVWKSRKKDKVNISFVRPEGWLKRPPEEWNIEVAGIRFILRPTDFGHLGIFPEQAAVWDRLKKNIQKGERWLNLFAYSGGSTLAAAKAGAQVCHVDASKGMVQWARENAELNGLDGIRWIVDDAIKFMQREVRRGQTYDGIILDPPSFGRGSKGEVFKIEEEIQTLLSLAKQLKPKHVVFSCHTPGYSPLVVEHLLRQFGNGTIETGEMVLAGAMRVPSGVYGFYDQ